METLRTAQPDAAILSADWLVTSMEKGVVEAESKYDLVPTTDHVTPDNPLPTIRPARSSQVTIFITMTFVILEISVIFICECLVCQVCDQLTLV